MDTEKDATREAAIEAAIEKHLEQERTRLREHWRNEEVLRNIERTTHQLARSLVEHFLQTTGAHECVSRLVELGCDRDCIMTLLVMMHMDPVPPRWLGFKNRKELTRAVKKLRDAEGIVRGIEAHTSIVRHMGRDWIWFSMFPLLPNLIENYCSFVDLFLKPGSVRIDVPKEFLVDHVVKCTGSFCDREVASLIASLPGRNGYTPEAHAKWRSRQAILQ